MGKTEDSNRSNFQDVDISQLPTIDEIFSETKIGFWDTVKFIAVVPIAFLFMFVLVPAICILAEIKWRIFNR